MFFFSLGVFMRRVKVLSFRVRFIQGEQVVVGFQSYITVQYFLGWVQLFLFFTCEGYSYVFEVYRGLKYYCVIMRFCFSTWRVGGWGGIGDGEDVY